MADKPQIGNEVMGFSGFSKGLFLLFPVSPKRVNQNVGLWLWMVNFAVIVLQGVNKYTCCPLRSNSVYVVKIGILGTSCTTG